MRAIDRYLQERWMHHLFSFHTRCAGAYLNRMLQTKISRPTGRHIRAVMQWGETATAAMRLVVRCFTCYIRISREHDALLRLNGHLLRDIGLTPYDVDRIAQRPVWSRCWRWVRTCPLQDCSRSAICPLACRREPAHDLH
jgi:uncharacterized protein YjiS (DUF1127 family)